MADLVNVTMGAWYSSAMNETARAEMAGPLSVRGIRSGRPFHDEMESTMQNNWMTKAADYAKAIAAEKAGSTRKENAIAEQGLIAVAMGPDLVRWLGVEGNTLDLGVEATKVERSRLNRVATMGVIMGDLSAPTTDDDATALGAIWKVVRSARGLKAGERDRLGAQKFASWSGLASAVEATIKAKPVEADDKRIAKALKAAKSAMEALTDLSTSEAWDAEALTDLSDLIEGLEAVRTTVETDEEGNAREIA